MGSDTIAFSGSQSDPVQITLIYPWADTSDFWARIFLALTKWLEQLGIDYDTTEFASRQIELSLQSTFANQVAQDADFYDYVIFGKSEHAIQADCIDKLAANNGFSNYVRAFHTPLKDLANQPDIWFDFSSTAGALTMCDNMLGRLGSNVTMAMNPGIRGITDNQRSGGFKACVEEKGNWTTVYEHHGENQREGGFEGTSLIMQAYPEGTIIHIANTAMAMGSVEVQVSMSKEEDLLDRLEWRGLELDATPMRMGDDVGAAPAEAIRADLEGRADDHPLVFPGRITVVHDQMSAEEIGAFETEAFRFSGVGALER